MKEREIVVVFYRREYCDEKWQRLFDKTDLEALFSELVPELKRFDFQLSRADDPALQMKIKGYGDLLNSIRLRAPAQGIGNMCLGHVIGTSKNLDLAEDIRRGVNRVAFAPETIEPEGSDKIVCHNCGCGC